MYKPRPRIPQIDHIIEIICAWPEYQIDPNFITGNSKDPWVVKIRWMIIWILRRKGFSLTQISNHLNKDHTTVLNALQKMEYQISTDPKLNRTVNKLWAHLENKLPV